MKSITGLFIGTILCFLFSFASCGHIKTQEPPLEKLVLGKWNAYKNAQIRKDVEFTENGRFNYYFNDVLETNMTFDNVLYHHLTYEIKKDKNLNRLFIYGGDTKNLLINNIIEVQNDKLYKVNYKRLEGITHHIDEISTWKKVETHKTTASAEKILKTKIIFPKDFEGFALIAFEDDNGVPNQKEDNRLETLHVPPSGLLKTKAKPKPFAFAKKEVVYFIEKENGKLEEVELTIGNRYSGELISKNVDPDKVYVLNYGFNQIDRTKVNSKLFNSEVKNDVLFLGVGKPDSLSKVWNHLIESIQ